METQLINTVIERKRSLLKRLAHKFTQDPFEIDDLVQETLIRSLSSLEKLIQHPKLMSWLFVIMKNVYINQYRKQVHFNTYQRTIFITEEYEKNKGESNFLLRDIETALNRLDEKHYVCFTMYLEGYKYQEITTYLQVPEGTIKTRIHKSKTILQKQLHTYRE